MRGSNLIPYIGEVLSASPSFVVMISLIRFGHTRKR